MAKQFPKAPPNSYVPNQFQNRGFQPGEHIYQRKIESQQLPLPGDEIIYEDDKLKSQLSSPEPEYSEVDFPSASKIVDDNTHKGSKSSKCLLRTIVAVVGIVLALGIVLGIVFGIVLTRSDSESSTPGPTTVPPFIKPSWETWGRWFDCTVSCGGGVQRRTRACIDPLISDDVTCVGKPTDQQQCSQWKCPDRNFDCQYGVLNSDWDACECDGSIMTGRVMDEMKRPLSGANIYYSSRPAPGKELATTDSTGLFQIDGVCSISQQFLVTKPMFTSMEMQSISKAANTSSLFVTLRRLELPYISEQPETKIRQTGDSVRFCCLAESVSAIKKYEWFRNGDIIKEAYDGEDSLVIDNLQAEHAGTYKCRVENDMGAVYSEPATLSVIDSTSTSCSSEPVSRLISLPSDCVQPDTNRAEYDVGSCGDQECLRASKIDQTSCTDSKQEYSCCQPESEILDVTCNGYTLPVSKVVSCSCGTCTKQHRKIIGRVVAADSGEPLGNVLVYYNATDVTSTSPRNDGIFTFEVPSQVHRVALTLKDTYFKRVIDTTVVFNIGDSLVTYHVFRMKPIPAPYMVEDSTIENVIPLVDDGSDPVAELVLAPNAMYNSDGEMYQGPFNISVMNIDMRNVPDAEIAPGDFRTADPEGNLAELKSYGMFGFGFTDMSGNPLSVGGSSVVRVNQDMIPPCDNEDGTCDTSLWVFNEKSGTWEMASPLRETTRGSGRRHARQNINALGEVDIEPQFTWYNIDAFVNNERCWAKLIAYNRDELNPNGLLPNNYMVTSIIEEEGNAFLLRSDQFTIITSEFGVCVPQGCDSVNPNDSRFTTHLTATYNENTLTPAAYPNSSPYFSLTASDISQLQYRTMGSELIMKPFVSDDGPVYEGKGAAFFGGACNTATTQSKHFQFYCPTCDGNDIKCFSTVESVAPDPSRVIPLTFYPLYDPRNEIQEYCFIGIRVVTDAPAVRIIVTSEMGESSRNSNTRSRSVYGTRELLARKGNSNYIEACMEYKCSGDLYNPQRTTFDTTKITIDVKDAGSCMVTEALTTSFSTHFGDEGINLPAALPVSFPDSQTHGLDSGLHITNNIMNLQECLNDRYSPQTSKTDYCDVSPDGFIPAVEITCDNT